MKKILLFLLIPLIISDDMLKVKSTIDAGIDAIRQYIPEDQAMADLLKLYWIHSLKQTIDTQM